MLYNKTINCTLHDFKSFLSASSFLPLWFREAIKMLRMREIKARFRHLENCPAPFIKVLQGHWEAFDFFCYENQSQMPLVKQKVFIFPCSACPKFQMIWNINFIVFAFCLFVIVLKNLKIDLFYLQILFIHATSTM